MFQYKSALTTRRGYFNPIINAGKPKQQWLVDSYLQFEANNLNYIKTHQSDLRAESYEVLFDYVANLADNSNVLPGVAVILPYSFEGSPRNMRERCNDAMSMFSKCGAPDLFIRFTANPNWPEVVDTAAENNSPDDTVIF